MLLFYFQEVFYEEFKLEVGQVYKMDCLHVLSYLQEWFNDILPLQEGESHTTYPEK